MNTEQKVNALVSLTQGLLASGHYTHQGNLASVLGTVKHTGGLPRYFSKCVEDAEYLLNEIEETARRAIPVDGVPSEQAKEE